MSSIISPKQDGQIQALESRIVFLEARIQNILSWQFNIANAMSGGLWSDSSKVDALGPSPINFAAVSTPPVSDLSKFDVLEPSTNLVASPSEGSTSSRTFDERTPTLVEQISPNLVDNAFKNAATNVEIKEIALEIDAIADSPDPQPVAALPSVKLPVLDNAPSTTLSMSILNIMEKYGSHLPDASNGFSENFWVGKYKFLDIVREQVNSNKPVKMAMPSFPWKSINKVDKVNGILPDLGEVLALARLNHLCKEIKEVYPAGAILTIATDGLVFDDIVGITDEATWAYGEALMFIISEQQFNDIQLVRVPELQGLVDTPMSKDVYLELAQTSRTKLLNEYGRTEDEIRELISTDEDSKLTYRGFIRFLEKDLKHSTIAKDATSRTAFRKCVKQVAHNMMIRSESFTNFLAEKCKDHVRLSIHPSTGQIKLSMPLIITPGNGFPRSPWHCTIALGVDGSYSTVHAKDVRDTHTLIFFRGEPYYWRENSLLWDDWDQNAIIFEPRYPKFLHVYPTDISKNQILDGNQIEKLREISQTYGGELVVSGFVNSADVFPQDARTCDVTAKVSGKVLKFERNRVSLEQICGEEREADGRKTEATKSLEEIDTTQKLLNDEGGSAGEFEDALEKTVERQDTEQKPSEEVSESVGEFKDALKIITEDKDTKRKLPNDIGGSVEVQDADVVKDVAENSKEIFAVESGEKEGEERK